MKNDSIAEAITRKNVRKSIVGRWVEQEIQRCKALHYRYARRLKILSESGVPASIRYTEKNGELYYSEAWNEYGVRKTRYLGKAESKEVAEAKEKRFLEAALRELDRHTSQLDKFAEAFGRFDPSEVNAALPRAYRFSDKALEMVAGSDEETEWYMKAIRLKEASEKGLSDYFKYGRRHGAKDGTATRSKSEMSIANALFDRGIKYLYELPLIIKGVPIHPDFTFYSYSRGKVMYWEHAGMLGDEDYRQKFAERVSMYIAGGFVPGVDVIFTFDTADGALDAAMIEAVIDEYM